MKSKPFIAFLLILLLQNNSFAQVPNSTACALYTGPQPTCNISEQARWEMCQPTEKPIVHEPGYIELITPYLEYVNAIIQYFLLFHRTLLPNERFDSIRPYVRSAGALLTAGRLIGHFAQHRALSLYSSITLGVVSMALVIPEGIQLWRNWGAAIRERANQQLTPQQHHEKFTALTSRFIQGAGKRVEDICSICREGYTDPLSYTHVKCEHTFHLACLTQWANQLAQTRSNNNLCPECRG